MAITRPSLSTWVTSDAASDGGDALAHVFGRSRARIEAVVDAHLHDVAQRGLAKRHLLRPQSIQVQIAVVADHQALLGIEHAKPLRHVGEGGVELQVLQLQQLLVLREQAVLLFDLGVQPLALGDVLVRADQAAVGQRSAHYRDEPAVGKREDLAHLAAKAGNALLDELLPLDIGVDAPSHAGLQDLPERGAGPHGLERQSIHLRVALVGNHDTLLVVEQAEALCHVRESGLQPPGLLGDLGFRCGNQQAARPGQLAQHRIEGLGERADLVVPTGEVGIVLDIEAAALANAQHVAGQPEDRLHQLSAHQPQAEAYRGQRCDQRKRREAPGPLRAFAQVRARLLDDPVDVATDRIEQSDKLDRGALERPVHQLQRRCLREAARRTEDALRGLIHLQARGADVLQHGLGNDAIVGREPGQLGLDVAVGSHDLRGELVHLVEIELGRDARDQPVLVLDQDAQVGELASRRVGLVEIALSLAGRCDERGAEEAGDHQRGQSGGSQCEQRLGAEALHDRAQMREVSSHFLPTYWAASTNSSDRLGSVLVEGEIQPQGQAQVGLHEPELAAHRNVMRRGQIADGTGYLCDDGGRLVGVLHDARIGGVGDVQGVLDEAMRRAGRLHDHEDGLIRAADLGPILDAPGEEIGELRVAQGVQRVARMHDDLHVGVGDMLSDIVGHVDEARLARVHDRGDVGERLGQHGDVGLALDQIRQAVAGAARQYRQLHPGARLDLGLVRAHQSIGDGGGAVHLDFGADGAGDQGKQAEQGKSCNLQVCAGKRHDLPSRTTPPRATWQIRINSELPAKLNCGLPVEPMRTPIRGSRPGLRDATPRRAAAAD